MVTGMNIVVVEDHDLAREELVTLLQGQGWHVDGADCGEELNNLLRQRRYHLVVLDLNLPQEDGLSIAARLRESHPDMWIVMLTARTRATERSEGYKAGADVYIAKPVNPDELLAVIANCEVRINPVFEGGAQLNMADRKLTLASGFEVRLTLSEALLIEAIMLMPDRMAHTDYLLENLSPGGDQALSRDQLTVMVSRLRSKVQDADAGLDSPFISAVRGVGYRLDCAVLVR